MEAPVRIEEDDQNWSDSGNGSSSSCFLVHVLYSFTMSSSSSWFWALWVSDSRELQTLRDELWTLKLCYVWRDFNLWMNNFLSWCRVSIFESKSEKYLILNLRENQRELREWWESFESDFLENDWWNLKWWWNEFIESWMLTELASVKFQLCKSVRKFKLLNSSVRVN